MILYRQRYFLVKVLMFCIAFCKRCIILTKLPKYDVIFIHREVIPLGPPVYEWLIAKILNKKIIYDFDDAIWLKNTSQTNWIVRGLKWHQKVGSICKWANKVSVGNEYLARYAKKYNPNVIIIPTVVDTEKYHNKIQNHSLYKANIGWTGSHSTIKYLDLIVPAIKRLEKKYSFTFYVISNVKPDVTLSSLKWIKWNKKTEIADLLCFHIGLMPLSDTPWTRGKCGFKAIQYMSLGIPALVSPIAVNTEIITHGLNGYYCNSTEEWITNIEKLMNEFLTRKRMGSYGRNHIEKHYSVKATKEAFLSLFFDNDKEQREP